jgi:cholesterol oxidase
MQLKERYDFVIIGSGFGGSVSALRLVEKGYDVLLIEKGRRFEAKDFPKTNLQLKKWLWLPLMRCFGIFKITLFKHVGVVSGVGYGGGSLVYANTLPIPEKAFFNSGSWAELADWENELKAHYATAEKMLGSTPTPKAGPADLALKELAKREGKIDDYSATKVAVYFGEEGKTVADPFFNGAGPDRAGCTYCGACMTGCRENAKNTLDKNYLYLAEKKGLDVLTEKEVVDVQPLDESGSKGYTIRYRNSTKVNKKSAEIKSNAVVFSGGVLGSVKLLLQLKKNSLVKLSDRLGNDIRTNNESLIGIINDKNKEDFSKGVAIGSIVHTDENSHLEVVRYGKGSSFWRFTFAPLAYGNTLLGRIGNLIKNTLKKPFRIAKIALQWNFTTKNSILLFMQTLDSTLQFKSKGKGMRSTLQNGPKPSSFIPEAEDLARKYSEIVDGEPFILSSEVITGSPTTAHILGGCVMGSNDKEGVIDKDHKIFNYENLWVIDGAAVSANPGVNPSLTITALAERAMGKIPSKRQ